MRIVIAGAGRVGGDLANALADAGHDVTVLDMSAEALDKLGSTFDGTSHRGIAYDVGDLAEAGIRSADVFVAVTDSDNANLMAVEVAKKVFDVPRSVARLDDPAREEAYRALDVEYVAGAKLVSRVIYESVIDPEFRFHTTFEDGDIEIVEFVLGSAAEGSVVADLEVDGQLRVAALRRGEDVMVPDGSFALAVGDRVVASAKRGARSKVARFLAPTRA
jgi:trk system potassium uptake protein TrkA